MLDTLQDMLVNHIEANDDNFEVEMGDDSFDYEYGSIRGTHGGVYCDVSCGGTATLTFSVAADEVDEDVVAGYDFGVSVSGPRDSDLDVTATVDSITVSEATEGGDVTVTVVISYEGSGGGSTDKDWGRDYDDYDDSYDDSDYGPYGYSPY